MKLTWQTEQDFQATIVKIDARYRSINHDIADPKAEVDVVFDVQLCVVDPSRNKMYFPRFMSCVFDHDTNEFIPKKEAQYWEHVNAAQNFEAAVEGIYKVMAGSHE